MASISNTEAYELQSKYNLTVAQMDGIITSLLATYGNYATKEMLEEQIKGYLFNLRMAGILEPQAEQVGQKVVNEIRGYDVMLVTHKEVMTMYDEASYRTYATLKAVSNFEGTTIGEWNNYVRKRGAKKVILDLMNEAEKEFKGKVPAARTVERQITKLINNGIPLIKVENHNGKVYYKLLNCIDGKYYVRIPYEKVRELVVSTSNNALKICAVMTYLCDEEHSKMEKVYKDGKVYFTISRKCVAEAIGLSTLSDSNLKTIGITLTSLCNLGFLECLETVEASKDGNTYKTIHSYRITTIDEYRQAKKRGFVS